MGNSVLVHLDRLCTVQRMGCGISCLPSGTAVQDLLLGSVSVPAGAGMCAWCMQTCMCVSLWVVWAMCVLCLGLNADGEDRDLALITQQQQGSAIRTAVHRDEEEPIARL